MKRRAPGRLVLAAGLLVAITACSPVFNWRDARLGESGLVALLPCKPDHATRDVVLGGEQVAMQMAGCEAGGATFTMAYVVARDATQAADWQAAWKTTMTARLQAQAPVESAIDVRGAANTPAPVQLAIRGGDATGSGVPARAWWFAQASNASQLGEVTLYQAVVLGQASEPDAADTFFESLRLP